MFLIVIHLFVSVCRAVVPRQPPWVFHVRLPRCDSPTRPRLTYHKLPRLTRKGDEIHPLRQSRNVNLLVFSRDLACQQGLTHKVGNLEFGMMNAECGMMNGTSE